MENNHPLESFRRKDPVSKMIEDSFASLDHVLGYITYRIIENDATSPSDKIVAEQIEKRILDMFDSFTELEEQLSHIVPADDFK